MALDNVMSHFSTMLESITSAIFPSSLSIIHFVADLQKDRNRERRSKPLRQDDGFFEDWQKAWGFDKICPILQTTHWPQLFTHKCLGWMNQSLLLCGFLPGSRLLARYSCAFFVVAIARTQWKKSSKKLENEALCRREQIHVKFYNFHTACDRNNELNCT